VTGWTASARALAVGAALLGACSGDDPVASPSTTEATSTSDSTTTSTSAPPRPESTTTTAYDASTVEGQIEAAYLRSWDVYAAAVYNLELDEAKLAEVYAGDSLAGKTKEIQQRVMEGRAALAVVDHDYEVIVLSDQVAHVVDRLTNHQVLIDPVTKLPIEEDPNEVLNFSFQMKLLPAGWRVTFIERVS